MTKAGPASRQGRLSRVLRWKRRYCFFSSFDGSWLAPDEDEGVLDEPLAAPELELGEALEPGEDELGEELELAPPDAESFFSVSVADEELDEDDGLLGVVVALPEPDAAPDGLLGVVVPDAAPELEEGERAPVSPVPALSPQAESMLAPNARDTTAARVESLISGPPWLG